MNLAEIEPDSMALRLAEVVNRRVGLRPADAVRKVASSLACVEDAHRLAYVERMIAASPRDRDWIDFVERMLVHETYFFRHTAQLDLLRDDILPRLDAQRREAGRPMLVVWIAGCSTGEEAWTMAFLAHARGAGVFGEAVPVSILATDLSETSLATARHGVYDRLHGLDSFRAIPLWAGTPNARLYDRAALAEGQVLEGPAIIEERETTVVIPPGWTGVVDAIGCITATRSA